MVGIPNLVDSPCNEKKISLIVKNFSLFTLKVN